MTSPSTTSRTRTARRESARRCSWILPTRRAAWWLAPATSPSWHLAGPPTAATTCRCTPSTRNVPRPSCVTLCATWPIPAETARKLRSSTTFLGHPSRRSFCPPRRTAPLPSAPRTLLAPTGCTTSSCTRSCAATPPHKAYRLARYAWRHRQARRCSSGKTFYRRYFAQQFKRSCLPDRAKGWLGNRLRRRTARMPSDACATLWLRELEEL